MRNVPTMMVLAERANHRNLQLHERCLVCGSGPETAKGCRNENKQLGVSNTPYNGGRWVTDGGWWVTDGGWCVTDGGLKHHSNCNSM